MFNPFKIKQLPTLRRLSRMVVLARATDLWERLWRGLIPPLVVLGMFLCVSWLGLWLDVPHWARAVGVAAFALLLVASGFGLRRLTPLSRPDALRRIDRSSGLAHRSASVLEDRSATAGRDPATDALWALHQRRAEADAAGMRVGLPSPRVVDLDKFALRGGVLVAMIACAIVAGPQRYARVVAAFDFGDATAANPGYRLDVWIDPPPYTGKPPILLNIADDKSRDLDRPAMVAAPAASVVVIRSSGGDAAEIETTGPLLPPPAKAATKPGGGDNEAVTTSGDDKQLGPVASVPGDAETRLVLHGDSRLVMRHGGSLRGVFDFTAIADQPPTIALRDVPKYNARGSLTLAYTTQDDYGVSKAEATFSSPTMDGEPFEGPSLVPPPVVALSLPGITSGIGAGDTRADLSDHPWAGARVTMTLVAHDEGGNEGRSEPVEITLPQKPFVNPVARAIVEQRRILVLSPGRRAAVGSALDALMAEPEAVGTTASVYLGLRFATDSLAHAEDNKQLIAVADFLWGMAQQIENGDLSDAEKALRAAEKALRDAIDNKASDEEIQKLTQNLQAAMDKFLKELAEQQRKEDRQESAADQSSASKSISQKDLQKLIERLKEQARSGNREEAKKALDELQDVLENLKTAKRQKTDPRNSAMAQGLNQLDQAMRDQQDLRDETYKQGQQGQDDQRQNGPPQGGDGQQGNDDAPGASPGRGQGHPKSPSKDLGQRQQELRDRLAKIQKKLRQAGEGQGALDDAGQDMREAEDALRQGEGSNGQAVDAQGRALDAMRKGAKKVADAMQQQGDPNGQANGDSKEGQGSQEGQQTGDSDPLGRPRGGRSIDSMAKFDPMGIPASQRAQRVLEELRRRLGDPFRSQEEIEYLERLLRSY